MAYPVTGAKISVSTSGVTEFVDAAIEEQCVHLRLSPLRFC